jgi:hypothetical protein
MTIEEAIQHCEEKSCSNSLCAQDHKQLAAWLTELKSLREQQKHFTCPCCCPAFQDGVKVGMKETSENIKNAAIDGYIVNNGTLPYPTIQFLTADLKAKNPNDGDKVKILILTKGVEQSIDASTDTDITDELLLLYGFEPHPEEGHHTRYVKYDEYREVELYEYSDSIWIFHHHNVEFSTPDTQITISYLHELRQALHLCGCLDLLTPNSK